jgi:hypothetical protein
LPTKKERKKKKEKEKNTKACTLSQQTQDQGWKEDTSQIRNNALSTDDHIPEYTNLSKI